MYIFIAYVKNTDLLTDELLCTKREQLSLVNLNLD